jgi:2-isopropylmalate synthase
MSDRVYLYDSTLRDGAQTFGIDFSTSDKLDIANWLDEIGIDYIEAGWPGANPTDDAFFAAPPKLAKAKLTAFGMTFRPNGEAKTDESLQKVLAAPTKTVCLVGKSWDFHVTETLHTSLEENLRMVAETVAFAKKKNKEVLFDAEHFFDGYAANPGYALEVIKTAFANGARWIVLCDTNGGTLPHVVERTIKKITNHIAGENLGIHCHNDCELAVANSLAAIEAGARQIQGTLNGVGERCGNGNLISLLPTLMLKLGYKTGVTSKGLEKITSLSRALDERLNRASNPYAAYVGSAAFTHKGGLHISAVNKNPQSYEHIAPEKVGNSRRILVSDQSGKAAVIARLKTLGLNPDAYKKEAIDGLINEVKQREGRGYSYDSADASFALLAYRILENVPEYFRLESFRVLDERRFAENGEIASLSEATAKIRIGRMRKLTVAEGNGPVNALDKAMRKALSGRYPLLKQTRLIDFKVRILTPDAGTEAITRVLIESADDSGKRWCTMGVSVNILDASYHALSDSLIYALFRFGIK